MLRVSARRARQRVSPHRSCAGRLRAIALATRGMLRRHQWLMAFAGGRPPLGPSTLLGLERSLATLATLSAL